MRGNGPVDLICYQHTGWEMDIRPASPTREWMDQSSLKFAYRCLPLNIANAYGWEILNNTHAEAYWAGGNQVEDVIVKSDGSTHAPVSIFGEGVLTFHIHGIFRTPKGWNLQVGGSPNSPKDAIYPLSGIIETDWAPYTFTMNWKFTRRNHWVPFVKGEPICFIQPVQRGSLEGFKPRFASLDHAPDLKDQFERWSRSRNEFRQEMKVTRPQAPTDQWQKRYYQGLDMDGNEPSKDHQAKVRLRPFG